MYFNLSEETGRNNRYFSEDNSSSYINQKDLETDNEEKILQGADGTKYLYSPFLTEEDGKKVEEETGLLLKREENGKVTSFLG